MARSSESIDYTVEETLTDDTCGEGPGLAEVSIQGDEPLEAFDEDVEEGAVAAGWVKPDFSGIAEIKIGMDAEADTHAELTVLKTYSDTVFTAQFWRVCVLEDPVAGTSQVTEELVGQAGGFVGGIVEFDIGEMRMEPCTDADYGHDDAYFEDETEFPAGTRPG